ncbi:hypothetical protein DFQ26_005075 [Actinomortierella ambigua]|nr:hypothetical protein DFQ26_005075 [Actinomortierella ambigua]
MLLRASSYTSVVLSTLTLLGYLSTNLSTVEAHSWLACCDWRFKNPGSNKWGDGDGECHGYARRYPLKGEFYSLDSANPSRHYQQDHVKDPLPCSDHKAGKDVGADETKADPIEAAYGGSKYGPMTETRVGQELCLRWPAKNHAEDNENDTEVQVYLSKNKDSPDPTKQSQLKDSFRVDLKFKNCNSAKNSDRRPCGGCFTVPPRAAGYYLLQWRWELNPDEWYTSCADVKIGK